MPWIGSIIPGSGFVRTSKMAVQGVEGTVVTGITREMVMQNKATKVVRRRKGTTQKKKEKAIARAVELRIIGKPWKEIGKEVGMRVGTVWGSIQKSELKELIEKKQLEYLEGTVDGSLEGLKTLIGADRDDLCGDDRKMQYDAWMKTAQAVGVYPSNQTSVVVQKLNQINIFQQPQLKEAMGNFVKYLAGPAKTEEGEVIDAELANGAG
jgi:hypothetical protein